MERYEMVIPPKDEKKALTLDLLTKILVITEGKNTVDHLIPLVPVQTTGSDFDKNPLLKYFFKDGKWVQIRVSVSKQNLSMHPLNERHNYSVILLWATDTESSEDKFLCGLEIQPIDPTKQPFTIEDVSEDASIPIEIRNPASLEVLRSYNALLNVVNPIINVCLDKVVN